MFRNLMIGIAGAAICTAVLGNVAHAAEKAFTVSQIELKAGKLIISGKTAKAKTAIKVAPFGKTVKSNAKKQFQLTFLPAVANLAACTATLSVGTTKQTLPISGCGPKGATGAKGKTGPVGPKGATGPQGATGLQGATGPKGDTGEQGPAGSSGVNSVLQVAGGVNTTSNTSGQWKFLGPTNSVTVTADQTVIFHADTALASGGAAFAFDLAACFQQGNAIPQLFFNSVVPSAYLTMTLSDNASGYRSFGASAAGQLGDGTFNVGMCVRNPSNKSITGDLVVGYIMVTK